MSLHAPDLPYPLLCLTRSMGICIVRRPPELERCNAAAFWRGKFFDGLRIVDPNGETYEVVRVRIRSPSARLGQLLARLLDLPLSVEVEMKPAKVVSVAEIRQIIEEAIDEDAESFEEFSGKSVDWWRGALDASKSTGDLIRTLETTRG